MTHSPNLTGMLEQLVNDVAGAHSAVVAAVDGVCRYYYGMGQDDADGLAAMVTSIEGLNRQIGAKYGAGGVQQHSVQFTNAVLAVMGVSSGTTLAVLGETDTDLGVLGYEMARLGRQIPQYLRTPDR